MLRKIIKRLLLFLLICVILLVGVIVYCNVTITNSAKNKLYNSVKNIPYNRVALVFGTSPRLSNGQKNEYFYNRMDAVVALFNAGKISCIILSGDNRNMNYNEPQEMKRELMKRGIPEENLILDYAGLRTLDSVIRSKEIFGQTDITFISQAFQNERAIFIANKYDINAIGFNAQDVSAYKGFKTRVREFFARVKAHIDIFTNKAPRHLGDKIEI